MTVVPAEHAAKIENIIGAAPIELPTALTHSEFTDWLRSEDMDGRLVNFLAQRDDCAGATPSQWVRLARLGNSEWFCELSSDARRAISLGIIGQQAFNAYVNWLVPSV